MHTYRTLDTYGLCSVYPVWRDGELQRIEQHWDTIKTTHTLRTEKPYAAIAVPGPAGLMAYVLNGQLHNNNNNAAPVPVPPETTFVAGSSRDVVVTKNDGTFTVYCAHTLQRLFDVVGMWATAYPRHVFVWDDQRVMQAYTSAGLLVWKQTMAGRVWPSDVLGTFALEVGDHTTLFVNDLPVHTEIGLGNISPNGQRFFVHTPEAGITVRKTSEPAKVGAAQACRNISYWSISDAGDFIRYAENDDDCFMRIRIPGNYY